MNMRWSQWSPDIWYTEQLPHLDDPRCDDKQVRQFNGQVSQILQCRIVHFVRICKSRSHCSLYIAHVELRNLYQWTGFEFSGMTEPWCLIHIISYWTISGTPDTTIAQEFGIFSDSKMLNNLQRNAKENRNQLLDLSGTDWARYISNHRGIENLSKWYPVDISYPETWLAYFRHTWRLQLSISSLQNEIQAHLRSTLPSRLMVSDLSPHAYSFQHPILRSRHLSLTDNPTPDISLNRAYPLRITLQWFLLLLSKQISFYLNSLNLWLPANIECTSCIH
jgi:hypothetical protein